MKVKIVAADISLKILRAATFLQIIQLKIATFKKKTTRVSRFLVQSQVKKLVLKL